MAFRKINESAKSEVNTGFGTNTSDYGGRFVNKDGNANIEKTGIPFFQKISWYHTMLALSTMHFFLVIFIFFIVINLLFAIIYFTNGAEHLGGLVYTSPADKFIETFFFSCQTFTTVGYGRVNPVGIFASAVASMEALIGLLFFAVATGLMYGRFSKPKAYIRFSENALLAPYKDITALMFRVAPFKNNTLIDAEVKVTMGLVIEENGKSVNKFFQLPLELERINTLTLSWTVVHPITEESPLHNFTVEDFENMRGEILVFIKAFDDMFSNTVTARSSYIFKEIVYGAKFNPMYKRSARGNKTVLYLDKLNEYASAELPMPAELSKLSQEA